MSEPLTGVWDRFMTPGVKVQYAQRENPDTGEIETVGTEYDFSAENLAQIVQNFSHTFSERRLPMDSGNHIAADPGHTDVQELARYSGLAAIWGGKVVAFWDQFPDLAPPDPATLLAGLQQKFPRASSADGLWGYRREVTDLGAERLPNMHQTSPQFSKEDTDEAGNPIGYAISAVSPVFVAHQNGTVLMSKPITMGQPSSAVHAPRPLGEEAKMTTMQASLTNGIERQLQQALRGGKSMSLDALVDAIAGSFRDRKDASDTVQDAIQKGMLRQTHSGAYMWAGDYTPGMSKGATMAKSDEKPAEGEGKPDFMTKMSALMDGLDPDQQQMMAAACYAKMAEMMAPKDASAEVVDKDKDGMGKPAAMSDLPKEEKPGDIPAAANSSTNFAKAGPEIIAALSKRTEAAEKAAAAAQARLDAMEKEKHEAALTTFAKWAVDDEGRWPEGDHAGCVSFAKKLGLSEAKAHILQHMPPRAAFGRQTQGGHPVGTPPAALKGKGGKDATFSKRTWEIFASDAECVAMNKIPGKGNEAFALAQRKARAEMPEAYDTEFRASN